MLSEVIHSRHSYWAVRLASEPTHQRSVHSGPLVLGANLFNIRTAAEDRKPTCLTHLCFTSSCGFQTRGTFITEGIGLELQLAFTQVCQRIVSTGLSSRVPSESSRNLRLNNLFTNYRPNFCKQKF
jgi:hypothetical protein